MRKLMYRDKIATFNGDARNDLRPCSELANGEDDVLSTGVP